MNMTWYLVLWDMQGQQLRTSPCFIDLHLFYQSHSLWTSGGVRALAIVRVVDRAWKCDRAGRVDRHCLCLSGIHFSFQLPLHFPLRIALPIGSLLGTVSQVLSPAQPKVRHLPQARPVRLSLQRIWIPNKITQRRNWLELTHPVSSAYKRLPIALAFLHPWDCPSSFPFWGWAFYLFLWVSSFW